MDTHPKQEPTSFEELADYVAQLLALVSEPVLHLIVPPTVEREAFIERVVERLGGGLVLTPTRRSVPWIPFDHALRALQEHNVLVLVPQANPIKESGSDIEAVRREAVARKRLLAIVTDAAEWFDSVQLEAPPRSILRVELREAELRVAVLDDWTRAYLRIPRDGSRPEIVVRDANLIPQFEELASEAEN